MMQWEPHIEVIFEFNGTRKHPVRNGYRPSHLVTGTYLSSGIHQYYGVDAVPPNGSAMYDLLYHPGGLSPQLVGGKTHSYTGRRSHCGLCHYHKDFQSHFAGIIPYSRKKHLHLSIFKTYLP